MNFKSNLALLFSLIALVIAIVVLIKKPVATSEEKDKKETAVSPEPEVEEPELEVAHFMTRIQVFHNKLYFAGKNKNLKLAQFYLNELEEEMGVIAEAGVFTVDGNISANMKEYGIKQVDWLRKKLDSGFDNFETDYDILTTSCNSCHTVTKQEHVKIITPTAPVFTNQDYLP